MSTLLYASGNLVTMGSVFNTENSYLYKGPESTIDVVNLNFTKTRRLENNVVFTETTEGIQITNFTQVAIRESLPPAIPTVGPFIENYSKDGTLNSETFINLLLIDKPPIRTGYFQFTIGDISFPGFITKTTPYTFYNWEQSGSKYTYVEQPEPLGYGIEISKNLLYVAVPNNSGGYDYFPTDLFNFLKFSLNGQSSEITSTATLSDPNTYLAAIPGDPESSGSSLPISLYYISANDALRFIASYPDLINSLGIDYTSAQILYSTDPRPITFNPIAYLNKYSDIRALYGYDTYAATIHYISVGYSQGRTADFSSTDDPLVGGLYDERNGAISAETNKIIFPQQYTLAGSGTSLSYYYNFKSYDLNSEIPVQSNLLYLGVH